ncbi:LPS export ABC transporter permease LptG [Neptunomonas antarctica]|uniref:Lipopolysaccharide export system permease protein n=1 Tax=Neptunomonas antarctica TaxID=619304 RepID=A0A1N7P984_9GAMM|nr:LPS export ABC transporter permease LptG [Neptunomonas antarctica]SIT07162.1 lipopolysaccharide export system permease protein [Neptunomonas antarctica]
MKRLDRYIGAQVLGAVFVILLIVIGLDLIFEFVEQAGEITKSYGFTDVLIYLILRVPSRIYEFLPLASLVGSLVGLGMLASNSELTVMRAAGISIQRIVMAVLKPAMLLAALALILGEYVVPQTEQLAQSSRALAQSAGKALGSQHGVWHREGNQFIHINVVQPNGKIRGITRYTFNDERQMQASSFAKSGLYTKEGWVLDSVVSTLFYDDHTAVEQRDQEVWPSGLTPTLLSVIVVDPMDLSITGLWSYSQYLNQQGLDSNQYRLAFWSKILQPAGILALVLIAISFIFGPLRSVTVGQRVIAGIIVGLIFKFSQDLLGPASTVIGFTPLLATAIPIIICLLLGLFLLRKAG